MRIAIFTSSSAIWREAGDPARKLTSTPVFRHWAATFSSFATTNIGAIQELLADALGYEILNHFNMARRLIRYFLHAFSTLDRFLLSIFSHQNKEESCLTISNPRRRGNDES
jgi:hypothetical protein